ncbi:MAG: hypothetical protein KF712_21130 [Akkermansiaceae bacterium]|nr:hypothetical protein [Akkermansiaceae bacterium]
MSSGEIESYGTVIWRDGNLVRKAWTEWRGYIAATGKTLVDWLEMAAMHDGKV